MARKTRQKRAIWQSIADADGPLTPREILANAKRRCQGLGIATVYRNINALVQQGDVLPVQLPGQPTRYEAAGAGHHHHFYCRRCGRVFPVEKCLPEWPTLAPPGFHPETHDIILYGACADCADRDD